jgi:hypothetical protein
MADYVNKDGTGGMVYVYKDGVTPPDDLNLRLATSADYAAISAAAPTPPTVPNPTGFIAAVKTALGGATGIRTLAAQLQMDVMLCADAINLGNWADVQTIIVADETALGSYYPAIKAAAVANNIPITLP